MSGAPSGGRPTGGPLAAILKSVSVIDLDGAGCGPPVDPDTFFGTDRVRLGVHICEAHCKIRDGCEKLAAKWFIQGAFSEPTIMGGRLWGAGSRKNFYTLPGEGVCPICNDDYSANVHIGAPPRKRTPHEPPPADKRARDPEPQGVG